VVLANGNSQFETVVPPMVLTAVAVEIAPPLSVVYISLPPDQYTFETWLITGELIEPITVDSSYNGGSGTMTVSDLNMSAVPLGSGGLYLASALLPFAARLARRRR
jgi:hypothetical protein